MGLPENKNSLDQDIHVMPREYFGVRGVAKAPESRPEAPVVPTPVTPTPGHLVAPVAPVLPRKKRNLFFWVILIGGLVILAGLLAYFIYLNYATPKAPPVVISNTTPEEVTVLPPVTETVVVPPAEELPAEIEEEPEAFNPTNIKPTKLSDLLGVDSDRDGLTDPEELLLGTGLEVPDTDGDGFYDGEELLNLYSPLASAVQLEESANIITYINPNFDYDLFYPEAWVARAVDKAGSEVIFSSALNEFVDVLVMDNSEGATLRAWYEKLVPDVEESRIVDFTNKYGLSGLWSPDEFTAYFVRGKFVYVVNYNIGLNDKANYPSIFKMMVNSFVFTGSEQ
jgi:hypothetical protein